MIKFIVGKIPGEVVEIEYGAETITVENAVKLGAAKLEFLYNASDNVYLNGDVSSFAATVSDNDVVLVDIPKIKGSQMVVRIGRAGSILKQMALHDDDTVNDALRAAKMEKLSENEVVYINDEKSSSSTHLEDGDFIIIKSITTSRESSGTPVKFINIYETLADLERRIIALES